NGAIPKSYPQSPPSPTNAQAARLRLFTGRREPNARLASIRHDERKRSVWRDGEFTADRAI
ncbi:hypothetical protein E4U38_006987, partial [Claviceps purpurea]